MSAAAPKGVDLNGNKVSYTDAETPNIQRIMDEGVTFVRAYAHPKCTPSRFSLLTGRYAVRAQFGIKETLKEEWADGGTKVSISLSKLELDDSIYNIPNTLKTIGNYHTGVVGKWHLMNG